MHGSAKRFYTPRTFCHDAQGVLANLPAFRNAARGNHVNRAFAEKIMLAVTQVNGCRYCAYGHTRLALKAGVEPDEVAKILDGELGDFPEEEAVALAFAQHWAETAGQPDPEAERRFLDYYGPAVSADILCWMRMINMGNLMGNTLDAVLHRLGLRRSGS